MTVNTLPDNGPSGQTLRGVAASGGIAIGPAFQFRRTDLRFDRRQVEDSGVEWKRFQNAVETARTQLAQMALQTERDLGSDAAAIFQAQMLMLEDPELLTRVRLALEEQQVNAEAALSDASGLYVHTASTSGPVRRTCGTSPPVSCASFWASVHAPIPFPLFPPSSWPTT
jgi:phosphoenolpyruvate-protein kinase (PTS system EI component)